MALYPCVRVFLKEQFSVVVDKDLLLTVQPNLHGRMPPLWGLNVRDFGVSIHLSPLWRYVNSLVHSYH